MREINDDDPTLEVLDSIHRELVTIIGHCTLHRSLLQDLILREASTSTAPSDTLAQWRDESLESIDRLRFSDLNKQDKALASAVFAEASRTAETFWNLLLAQADCRERLEGDDSELTPKSRTRAKEAEPRAVGGHASPAVLRAGRTE